MPTQAPDDQSAFYPQLCDDWCATLDQDPVTGGWPIKGGKLTDPDSKKPWIASVIVNPAFSEKNQRKIVWLMSYAPDLWRMLREVALGNLPFEIESVKEFADVWEMLWGAAGTNPFEMETEVPEVDVLSRCNGLVLEGLKAATNEKAEA